jgi:hypothetical protein
MNSLYENLTTLKLKYPKSTENKEAINNKASIRSEK